jgi:hypothetical protein
VQRGRSVSLWNIDVHILTEQRLQILNVALHCRIGDATGGNGETVRAQGKKK